MKKTLLILTCCVPGLALAASKIGEEQPTVYQVEYVSTTNSLAALNILTNELATANNSDKVNAALLKWAKSEITRKEKNLKNKDKTKVK